MAPEVLIGQIEPTRRAEIDTKPEDRPRAEQEQSVGAAGCRLAVPPAPQETLD